MASPVLSPAVEAVPAAVVVRSAGRRKAWWVLGCWTAVWALLSAAGGAYSWHYFAQGAYLISHPGVAGGGLHVYAVHPELQIGPLALLAAVPLQAFGGAVLAQLVLAAAGLVLLKLLVDVRDRCTGSPTSQTLLLATGALLLPVWCQVATHFTHLDDALAMTFCVAAVAAVVAQRPWLTALALAASIDSKPWALGFAALILALPRHQRARSAVVTAVGVALAWLPFVVGDPRTLQLGRFTIHNVTSSALQALGVHTAHTPSWDRPAQLALGVCVGLVCVRRGRWAAVPLAVVTSRLLLDPETYPYYSSGLLVCTAVLDLLRRDRRLPMWTLGAAAWVLLDRFGGAALSPSGLGALRAAYCLGVLAALVGLPSASLRSPSSGTWSVSRAARPAGRPAAAAGGASAAPRPPR